MTSETKEDRYPQFKIVLLGEPSVGKTSLLVRLRDDTFIRESQPTIISDSCQRTLHVDGEQITITTWDTAGIEKFKTVTRNYYRNAHAAILVYDMNDPASIHYLSKWANDALDFAPNALRILVGNKSDLEKTILSESVENFKYAHSCTSAFTVSAKTGLGVSETMQSIAEELMQVYKTPLFYESQYEDVVNLRTRKYHTRPPNKCC